MEYKFYSENVGPKQMRVQKKWVSQKIFVFQKKLCPNKFVSWENLCPKIMWFPKNWDLTKMSVLKSVGPIKLWVLKKLRSKSYQSQKCPKKIIGLKNVVSQQKFCFKKKSSKCRGLVGWLAGCLSDYIATSWPIL